MDTTSNWHKNGDLFHPSKLPYFAFYAVDAGCSIPEELKHYPSTINQYDAEQFTTPDANTALELSSFLSECTYYRFLPDVYDMDFANVIVLGPDAYKNSLIPGDMIIVHEDSAHAIMPDDKKWERSENEDTEPYVCIYLEQKVSYADGDIEYEYIVTKRTGETVSIYPGDIVRNIRYARQLQAAKNIQRMWREYRAQKILNAALILQRFWKHYMYKPPTSDKETCRQGYQMCLERWTHCL